MHSSGLIELALDTRWIRVGYAFEQLVGATTSALDDSKCMYGRTT